MTWRALLVVLFVAATGAVLRADDDSPAAERASFQIADGFEVSLFASEADGVVKPIQIRFDTRGRLWVIGSTVYPQLEPGQVPNDKVLILEDTDHDGKSDKTTVFADGLMIPTGLELGDGGAYVGHGTQLIHLKDTDGDGKADQRKVLFRGFGTGDSHQNINSFAWGPGGELFMCQGLSTQSRIETAYGIVSLPGAGLWRMYPKQMKLQRFYGSDLEPQNPWGYVFTDWGEPLVMAGNNSSPIYPVPGMVANRKIAAPTRIWPNGKGRKSSGADIVGTTHFPPAWQGQLLIGGYINNAIWNLKISDDGSGFVLDDRTPLITSTNRSFRPVDVKFAPDGSLYICDWYNPIIGHYQASLRDPRRDKTHGRIWRVTAKGRPLTPAPDLIGATTEQLLDNLGSKDRWTRQFSKRALAERPTGEVTAALDAWTAKPGRSDLNLKEALGVYQNHEVVRPELITRLSKSPLRSARAYAAGVIGSMADRLEDPLAMLAPLVQDADARVRLQGIVACTYVNKPRAIEVALAAVDLDRDKFIDYAIDQAVYSLKSQWVGPFNAGELTFDNKVARLSALIRADASPDTLKTLRELVKSPKIDAAARETFYRILADIGEPSDLSNILTLDDVAMKARLLPALAEAATVRNLKPEGNLAAAITGLLARPEPELRSGALTLSGAWKLREIAPAAVAIAQDNAQPEGVRVAATKSLGGLLETSAKDPLVQLADASQPAPVRTAAITTLAPIDLDTAATRAAKFISVAAPDASANELFVSLLGRAGSAPALVKAFNAERPAPDAAKIGLRVMSAIGRRDEALAALLGEIAGLNHGVKTLNEAQLAALVKDVREKGSAERGAAIFGRAESGCIACHAIAGKGGNIGPDLGSIGTAQTPEFIIGAILEPNREVREGYIAFEVTTKQGQSYQGYILREDAAELVIRDVARNQEVRLRKDSIAKKEQRGSVMPPGLATLLTDSEFRDLVCYLTSLGSNIQSGEAEK